MSLLQASCEKAASLIERGERSAFLNLDEELQDKIAMCLTPNLLRKCIKEGAIVVSDQVKKHVELTTSIFKDDAPIKAAYAAGVVPVIIGQHLATQPKHRYLCTASLDFAGDLGQQLPGRQTKVDIRPYLTKHTAGKMEGEVVIRPDTPGCETITLNYTGWSGTEDHSSVSDLKKLYSLKGKIAIVFANVPDVFTGPITMHGDSCIEVQCGYALNPYTNKPIQWQIHQAGDTPNVPATDAQSVEITQPSDGNGVPRSSAGQPKTVEQQAESTVQLESSGQPKEGNQTDETGPLRDIQRHGENGVSVAERQPESGQSETNQIESKQPEPKQVESEPFDAGVVKGGQ
jgi:hypothetical protein